MRRLAPLSTAACPVRRSAEEQQRALGAGDHATLRWIRPRVVVEVSFVEWARDGLLRHAEFVRLLPD
jgi:hypothetical protein